MQQMQEELEQEANDEQGMVGSALPIIRLMVSERAH